MLLNISPRWFFKHLEDLRELGAEIGYDRKRKTYFFKKEFDLESSIIKALKH